MPGRTESEVIDTATIRHIVSDDPDSVSPSVSLTDSFQSIASAATDETSPLRSTLPDGLELYENQIAGHRYSKKSADRLNILHDVTAGRVFKPLQSHPRGERELAFYNRIYGLSTPGCSFFEEREFETDIKLRQFTPNFHGTQTFHINDRDIRYLVLDDLTRPFHKPSILDVKVGYRTWDPSASVEKERYEVAKYPPGKSLSFRLLGMKVYDEANDCFISRDKYWGRTLRADDIPAALCQFLRIQQPSCQSPAGREHISTTIRAMLTRLESIDSFFARQQAYAFYSSSLLLIYESLPPSAVRVDVRMIDFTHTFNTPVDAPEPDANYRTGVQVLMRLLREQLLQIQTHEK